MKHNPFLLAGIFASLIFIINCDSNSSRSIKAAMPAKKLDNSNLPPCTGDIMTLITQRKKTVEDLNKKIEEYKDVDLTLAQKTELNTLVDNLKKKSNEVYKAIQAIKGKPRGCNSADSDNKKTTHLIESMKTENGSLGKKVSDMTGMANILTDDDDATSLIENQSYTLKAELARVMTKAKVDNMYVMDGKIFDSAGVADDLKSLKEKKNKTFCYLEASIGELTSAEQVRIIQIHPEMSADGKTATASIRWVANGDQLNSFSCNVQKASDVPTELRKIFGDLITLKNGVGTPRNQNPNPQQ